MKWHLFNFTYQVTNLCTMIQSEVCERLPASAGGTAHRELPKTFPRLGENTPKQPPSLGNVSGSPQRAAPPALAGSHSPQNRVSRDKLYNCFCTSYNVCLLCVCQTRQKAMFSPLNGAAKSWSGLVI